MKKAKVDAVPVIDHEGELLGIFSIQSLMRNLLPISVAVGGGVQLDVKVAAAPGIARRFDKIHSLSVSDVMDRKVVAVDPDMSLWEGINLLVQYGAPMPVVERGTGKTLGLITYQSALDEILKMKDAG